MDLKRIFMPRHSLTNFEIQKYYQNYSRFNGVYSGDNLPHKIKEWVSAINLDYYSVTGTHWIALFAINNNVIYFDSFGVEHIPKENKKFIDKSVVVINLFRIQVYDSGMCRYFCTGFIDFMLVGTALISFTNLFSPYNLKKNYDIILNYFMNIV